MEAPLMKRMLVCGCRLKHNLLQNIEFLKDWYYYIAA